MANGNDKNKKKKREKFRARATARPGARLPQLIEEAEKPVGAQEKEAQVTQQRQKIKDLLGPVQAPKVPFGEGVLGAFGGAQALSDLVNPQRAQSRQLFRELADINQPEDVADAKIRLEEAKDRFKKAGLDKSVEKLEQAEGELDELRALMQERDTAIETEEQERSPEESRRLFEILREEQEGQRGTFQRALLEGQPEKVQQFRESLTRRTDELQEFANKFPGVITPEEQEELTGDIEQLKKPVPFLDDVAKQQVDAGNAAFQSSIAQALGLGPNATIDQIRAAVQNGLGQFVQGDIEEATDRFLSLATMGSDDFKLDPNSQNLVNGITATIDKMQNRGFLENFLRLIALVVIGLNDPSAAFQMIREEQDHINELEIRRFNVIQSAKQKDEDLRKEALDLALRSEARAQRGTPRPKDDLAQQGKLLAARNRILDLDTFERRELQKASLNDPVVKGKIDALANINQQQMRAQLGRELTIEESEQAKQAAQDELITVIKR